MTTNDSSRTRETHFTSENRHQDESAEEKFKFYTPRELSEMEAPDWVVEGILPEKATAILVGAEGSGKTFTALDIALRVAMGIPWDGREVSRGPVLFLAQEGQPGFQDRVQAWRLEHDVTEGELSDFTLCFDPFLLHEKKEIDEMLEAYREKMGGNPSLIVIDTLARCMAGLDENLGKDMQRALAGIEKLKRETDATILLIHHPPHDGDRPRGSSALPAAVDTSMVLTEGSDERVLSCQKQRDWSRFPRQTLYLVKVGDSCVIRLDGERPLRLDDLSAKQRRILEELADDFPHPTRTGELLDRLQIPKQTFHDNRKELEEMELVESPDHGKWAATEDAAALFSDDATADERNEGVIPLPRRDGDEGGEAA